jgi:hypothetical protein
MKNGEKARYGEGEKNEEKKKENKGERETIIPGLFTPNAALLTIFLPRVFTPLKKKKGEEKKKEIPILCICILIQDALSSGLCSNS